MDKKYTFSFLGCGNMGGALAVAAAGGNAGMPVAVFDPMTEKALALADTFENVTVATMADAAGPASLDERLRHLDASFSETLLALIDERGLTDAEVYRRANLSRQYFSKLRSGAINPSKRVVLALAVALELDLDQTRLLLGRSGYALSRASMLDVIVEFFIEGGVYDPFTINEALFAWDQPLLGTS